jgi:hypothetical protein
MRLSCWLGKSVRAHAAQLQKRHVGRPTCGSTAEATCRSAGLQPNFGSDMTVRRHVAQ